MKKLLALLLFLPSIALGATGDKLVKNRNQDKDVKVNVNIGGTQTDALSVTGTTGSVAVGVLSATVPSNNFLNGGLGIRGLATTPFSISANNTVVNDTTYFPLIYNQGYPSGGSASPRAQFAGNSTAQIWGIGSDNANNMVFGSANSSTGIMTNIFFSASAAGTGTITMGPQVTPSSGPTRQLVVNGSTVAQVTAIPTSGTGRFPPKEYWIHADAATIDTSAQVVTVTTTDQGPFVATCAFRGSNGDIALFEASSSVNSGTAWQWSLRALGSTTVPASPGLGLSSGTYQNISYFGSPSEVQVTSNVNTVSVRRQSGTDTNVKLVCKIMEMGLTQ